MSVADYTGDCFRGCGREAVVRVGLTRLCARCCIVEIAEHGAHAILGPTHAQRVAAA